MQATITAGANLKPNATRFLSSVRTSPQIRDWLDFRRLCEIRACTLLPRPCNTPIAEGATSDQVRVMLQALLADRFKAVLHHETRDFPIFELTVAKSGSKLKTSSSAPSAAADGKGPNPVGSDGFPQLPSGATGMMGAIHNGVNRLIAGNDRALAKVLENEVGTRVVGRTGLTGTYDFNLDYVRDQGRAIGQFRGLPPRAPAAVDDSPEASALSTALQEQLGLKLEKTKGPRDVIVVDQANRTPTDN